MEAPAAGLSFKAFDSAIQKYIDTRCKKKNDGYDCKKCGSEIQQTTCYVSIHTSEFGDSCAGGGEVEVVPLPFCPACEGAPARTHTCIHVQMFG